MVMINFQLKMLERILQGVETSLDNITNLNYDNKRSDVDYNDPKRREEVDRHTRAALRRMSW